MPEFAEMSSRLSICLVPLVLVMTGCGSSADTAPDADGTPGGVNTNILSDADMAAGKGSDVRVDMSPEAIAAARLRAQELVGGEKALQPAPAAHALASGAPDTRAMVMAARAAVAPGGENCAETVAYGSAWAAKLPPAFPVYPRGTTVEAAGTDEGACSLRVVTFRTAVPLGDVLAFYSTRAKGAGFGVDHVTKAGDAVLSGTRGDDAYVVYGRQLESGATEIDLVTTGA